MKFTIATTLLTSILATGAIAAPAPAQVQAMAQAGTRTITNMKRVCDSKDTTCTWSFGIVDAGVSTGCGFTVKKSGNTPASQAPNKGTNCGAYRISSGWSGQFGPGNGFTTLSVVNNVRRDQSFPS